MDTLQSFFPTAVSLLALKPNDLAPILLKLASQRLQTAGFTVEAVTEVWIGGGMAATAHNGYPPHMKQQVDLLLNKTWNFIEREGFIEPSPGINGRNGWKVLTDEGTSIASGQDFQQLHELMKFPKTLLHPSIREKVWAGLLHRDYDGAVRTAFVTVEDTVRTAGKFAPTDIGVKLMRKAFDPQSGPLTNMENPEAEREGMAKFFEGAVGAWRNPVSHRGGVINELQEAQDLLMLASHLLRIVDVRRH